MNSSLLITYCDVQGAERKGPIASCVQFHGVSAICFVVNRLILILPSDEWRLFAATGDNISWRLLD
jgi:hypothetical protein